MNEPFISIIVLNWNGKRFLKECFDSLSVQTASNFEMIMVDNSSKDGSVDFARNNYPKVSILELKDNLGYTGANNAATGLARGDYLLFLNNDAKLDRDYIKELTSYIGGNPWAKIIATKEYSYDGKNFVSQSDGFDFLGYGCSYRPGKTCIAPGCAFVIEKKLFSELGGFDEKMFIFHEELDLCWRAYLVGEEVHRADRCRFFHLTGGVVSTWTIERRYLGERNNIRSVLKNYSCPVLFIILPVYLFINCCEVFYLLLTGQLKTIKEGYWRAWLDNIKDFKNILREHNKIQRQRTVNDFEYLKRTRLVIGKWQAYLKTRKILSFR